MKVPDGAGSVLRGTGIGLGGADACEECDILVIRKLVGNGVVLPVKDTAEVVVVVARHAVDGDVVV